MSDAIFRTDNREASRKKLEASGPHQTRHELSTFLSTLPFAAYVCDVEGRITYYNQPAVELWGQPPSADQRYCGSNRIISLSGEVIPHEACAVAIALATGEDQEGEVLVECGGGQRHVIAKVLVIHDAGGSVVGAVNYLTDATPQRIAENHAQRSQSLQESVMNSTADGICIFDFVDEFPFLKFSVWNDRLAEITGYSHAEINEFGFPVLFPEQEQLVRASARIREIREGADISGEPWQICTKSEETRDVLVSTTRIHTDARVIVIAVVHDITEIRRAEEKLRAGEARYRSLVEVIPDMIFRLDGNGVFKDFKPSNAPNELLAPPEDFLNKHYSQFLPSPVASQYQEAAEAAIESEHPQLFDFELELPSGSRQQYECRVMSVPIGDIVAVVRNVTKEKEAREAVAESERKYRNLVETLHSLIYSTDADGILTFVNENGAREILGYEPSELVGRHFQDFTVQDHLESDLAFFAKLLDGEPIYHYETELYRKDGSIAVLNINAIPVANEFGEVIGMFSTATDVSRRRRAESAMQLIVEGTLRTTGMEFFRSLVKHLSTALGHEYIVLAQLNTDLSTTARTIAFWSEDHFSPNFEFALVGTPCETVAKGEVCCYPSNVKEAFPNDHFLVEFGAESYIGTPLVDANGNVVGLLASISKRPIGEATEILRLLRFFAHQAAAEFERTQAEDRLRDSQRQLSDALERLELAVNGTSDGIWDWDLETDRVWVSPRAMELLGHDTKATVNDAHLWFEEVHPDDNPLLQKALQCHFEDGDTFDFELRMRKSDGKYDWFRTRGRSVAGPSGTPQRMSGSITDISDRKKSEFALKESEENYRTIVQSAPDALLVVLAEGKNEGQIVSANQRAAELYGYDLASLVGRKVSEFESPDGNLSVQDRLVEIRKGGRLNFENLRRHENGKSFPVEVTGERILLNGRVHALFFERDISERKLAEQTVRESEARYRTMFQSAPDMMFVLATQGSDAGRIVSANEMAAKAHGFELSELIGMNINDLDVPESAKHTPERIRRLLDGERLCFEVEHCRKDGTTFPVEVTAEKIMLNGKPHILAFDRDVTERKKSERLIAESQERLRLATDAANMGTWDWDLVNNTVLFSTEWKRQLGYQDHEITNSFSEWRQRLHPDDVEIVEKKLNAYLSKQTEEYAVEFRLLHQDGSYRWIYSRGEAHWDESNRPIRMVGCHLDVTERKVAEQAVRESEQKLAAIASTLPQALYVWDVIEQETVYSNRGIAQDLGYSEEEVQLSGPKLVVDLLHPEDLKALPEKLSRWKEVRDNEIIETEYRLRDADGNWRWYLSRDTVYKRTPDGRVKQILGISQDITQRKLAAEERQRLEAQMLHTQKLESLGVLAGGIAHDFNNLLTAILGYSTLAQSKVESDSVVHSMLREIQTASQHAADLTKQMLAYAGKSRITVESIELDQLVEEMFGLLNSVVTKRAVLHFDLQPASVSGDATQIRQILMNLISNASEALEAGTGNIRVAVGIKTLEQDLHSPYIPESLPPGEYAFLRIEDEGCGMPPEVLARIFDPFFSTKFTGRGLGLAAVLGIVRSHNGTITIDSRRQSGTTFEILFPATTSQVQTVVEESTLSTQGSGTVLVIEDEKDVLRLASMILQDAGFQVLAASGGKEGLAILEANKNSVNAVLLDLTMPEMDGVEVLKRIREDSDVPVLLTSGYTEQHLAPKLDGVKADGFIQKPFHSRQLVERILALCTSAD